MGKEFSIQRIRAAGAQSKYNGDIDGLVLALTRSPCIRAGEVYYYPLKIGGGYAMQRLDVELVGDERSLTTDEVPGWKRDKEALQLAIEGLTAIIIQPDSAIGSLKNEAKSALTKIKEISGVGS